MIKINLLQARKEKKKVGFRKEFIVLIGSVLLLVVLLVFVQWRLNKEKNEKLAHIAQLKDEIAQNKVQIAEANKAREAQKDLQARLDAINTVKKQKGVVQA